MARILLSNLLLLSVGLLFLGSAVAPAHAEEGTAAAGEVKVETTIDTSTEADADAATEADCAQQVIDGKEPSEDCVSKKEADNAKDGAAESDEKIETIE